VTLGLALHTCTPDLGLALGQDGNLIKQEQYPLGRAMAAQLHSTLAAFLQPYRWPDLKFLAIARGPGGFTGTRLGMVTARTLGQQLDVPVFAISTLLAYGIQCWQADASLADLLALELPVQRGQIATALYQRQWAQPAFRGPSPPDFRLIQPEAVWDPLQWEAQLQALSLPLARLQVEAPFASSVDAVFQLAARAYAEGDRPGWALAEPFYGQHPVTISDAHPLGK
jgi:tRNA threonylcarbamoyl adenosine modification protein YeaZ